MRENRLLLFVLQMSKADPGRSSASALLALMLLTSSSTTTGFATADSDWLVMGRPTGRFDLSLFDRLTCLLSTVTEALF